MPTTYLRPTEPLVNKNPFLDRTCHAPRIPLYTEVRARLPIPILPEHPQWVEMYWRAWELAWLNLRRASPLAGFIANFIDTAFNENTFLWDSAFMMHFGLYGRRAFYFMGTLDNFYAHQHRDGYICREINTEDGHDFFHPFDPNSTGPNILAWAEWDYFRATGDSSRLHDVFWPLLTYHRWCRANRTWPNGLYWTTGLSSGMDNQTRVPDGMHHHRHWTWLDANLQAALNCLLLWQMAELLGEREYIQPLVHERVHLIQEVNARMWNSETSFYHDIDAQGHFSPVKSIGAYWGLLDPEMVPGERLLPFVKHLRDPLTFNRFHRVPSQAADSDGYAANGDYWRGGIWSPTNYMVLKGLRAVNQAALAHEIAVNHLTHVCTVFERTDTFWENYAPESAAPGEPAKPNFVGWTGLTPIAVLLEDVIGLNVDWPQRRVTWDRQLAADAAYGVYLYPLGPDGTLDILGDRERITVTTTLPFTLVVQDVEGKVQMAVPAGTTVIEV